MATFLFDGLVCVRARARAQKEEVDFLSQWAQEEPDLFVLKLLAEAKAIR